ncbi:MAG: HAMP domain-containing protein, partial [Anaerotignum sp.]|nr:HAMP domain-containing protein [Anaerotignum sp.]
MSRKNEFLTGFRHLAITKRITLLYGGLFTLSLLFLSLFMLWNIPDMQRSTTRRELQGSLEKVHEYLDDGKVLGNEVLMEMQGDGYVEISIFRYEDKNMYSTMGDLPPFIQPPFEEADSGELPDSRPPYLQEKELSKKGIEINIRRESAEGRLEYILENKSAQKFMLISDHHRTEDGLYRIQVFRMMADGKYMVLNFMSKLLIANVIGIICAFLIGQHISRRMLKPVAAIREAAERISIEDLSQRISTEGPDDEMKDLTVTFNSMIDRLETSFQKQNQFVSDASHELRTPISVIQGYANLINRWGKSDPAILQESIDSILTETDHMSA